MMVIGIDGNEANEVRKDIGERVGVNQYAFEILWGLYKLNFKEKNKHKYIIYLKSQPKNDLPKENEFFNYKILTGKRLWIIKKLMPYLLFRSEIDVLFSPSHYLPPITLIPTVCTIHDLGYLKFSGQFKKYDFWQLKLWSAISIYISKYIISVSESTKKDIVRHYPFASNKITITYHGYDPNKFNENISHDDVRHIKQKYNLGNDYILFLSTLKPSKNIDGVLDAYKLLLSKEKLKNKLVIAGKSGWLFQSLFEKVKDYNIEKQVVFTGFVKEKDKPALISGSKLLISPSFWEGFGMHVLEAMACGKPVLISNVASLPEVAGNAGIYVDPYNAKNIADGIKRILKKTSKDYNKLVNKSLKQAKKFSWEQSVRIILQVLESIK